MKFIQKAMHLLLMMCAQHIHLVSSNCYEILLQRERTLNVDLGATDKAIRSGEHWFEK